MFSHPGCKNVLNISLQGIRTLFFARAGPVGPLKSVLAVRNYGARTQVPPKQANVGYNPIDPLKGKIGKPFEMLLNALGFYSSGSVNIRSGEALFRSCEEQGYLVSKDDSFGLDFDWYDNKCFNARQQVLMLHIWMVHRRLLLESGRGKDVQDALFDTLWDTTTRHIRACGVHEMTVNKHLQQVQKICFTAAVQYDHGLNKTDDENLELGSAIWRNVYSSDPKTPDECVYRMADYVRSQIESLEDLSANDLFHGRLCWMDLEVESSSLAGEWRQAITAGGKTYYWNVKTRESRWEKPTSSSSPTSPSTTDASTATANA